MCNENYCFRLATIVGHKNVRPCGIAAVGTHFHTSGYYILFSIVVRISVLYHLMTLAVVVVPSV